MVSPARCLVHHTRVVKMAVVLWLLVLLPASLAAPGDVDELEGEADFRSVRLHWKYPADPGRLRHFAITYCEDQAWGKYRCKKQLLEEREAKQMGSKQQQQQEQQEQFEVVIKGLRMATNYTLEVTPVLATDPPPGRHLGQELTVRTKGFSARATQCLANSSVVEVETGPYFGGKISVEGTEDPQCRTEGERESTKTSYQLKIDHDRCGSQVHNTSVMTFILVQENLPILTHSTRRFLVMCSYIPETFTVRAGVSLPEDSNNLDDDMEPVDKNVFEVDPSELFDSTNNLFDSRLSEQVGRALKMSADEANKEPQMWAHLVLMVILVMAAVVGLSCALWHFVRHARAQNRQGFMSPQEEPQVMQETSSMEAVVRDYGRGAPAPHSVDHPVALFQTSFLSGGHELTADLCDLSSPHDLGTDDICHDLRPASACNGFPADEPYHNLQIGDPCQALTIVDLPDDLLLNSAILVETLNPVAYHELRSPIDPDHPANFDPHLLYDNYPVTEVSEINQTSSESMVLLDPQTLPHRGMTLPQQGMTLPQQGMTLPQQGMTLPQQGMTLPQQGMTLPQQGMTLPQQGMSDLSCPLVDGDTPVPALASSLSLQHLPQPFLVHHLPFHLEDQLSLGYSEGEEDDDCFDHDEDDDCFDDDCDGDCFDDCDGEEELDDGRCNFQDLHPSLDDNWRLGDGGGQIFPAFSQ